MSDQPQIVASSGNVFEDIGVAESDAVLAKTDLALAISTIISDHGWTQEDAAAALGIDQPKVSALMRGRLSGFSFERLMRFLNRLNYDVNVIVKESQTDNPRTSVQLDGGAPQASTPRRLQV